MFGSIRVCVPVIIFFFFLCSSNFFFFFFVLSSVYVMSLTMSIFTFYMFVYMYVHALTPPACGLSFICNKVLFCSVQQDMRFSIQIFAKRIHYGKVPCISPCF